MQLRSLESLNHVSKYRTVLLLSSALLLNSFASAQTASLTLASGSALPGGSVSVNLSVAGGAAASGLQWTLSYPSTDVTSLTAAAGPVLTAAGKTLNCVSGTTTLTCLATGMNAT